VLKDLSTGRSKIEKSESLSGAEGDSHRQETSLGQRDFTMGYVTRRVFKTRINVGFFKVGEVLQHLLRRHPAGKHFQYMAHRNSHAANCRLTTAHIRFDRDPVDMHETIL
jgi:hypothetical protein